MSEQPKGYETKDADIKGILISTAVSVVVIIIAVVLLYDYFIATREEVFYEQALRPESRELMELRRIEDSVLSTYELIDTANQTYRVPIHRAMELLAAESTGTTPR